MAGRTRDDVILLSIRPKFAREIFDGNKEYEFRKTALPSELAYILLMENGSREILGGFSVDEVIKEGIDTLWEKFGKGTSDKDRFYRYYEGWERGLAIKVDGSDEFENPIPIKEITKMDPNLSVPDQFTHIYLTNRALSLLTDYSETIRELFPNQTLDEWQCEKSPKTQDRSENPSLGIRKMHQSEEAEFRELVTNSPVPQEYDEIDETFTDHIVESHEMGEDPFGYFTKKKEIYAFLVNNEIAGFTVTTWKRGHSVKYGPTVLKSEYRNQGLGPKFRKKLDSKLESQGIKKTYSTILDNADNAYSYLIKSGYVIEAHMRKQYTNNHGELVFGKLLSDSDSVNWAEMTRSKERELEFAIGSDSFDGFSEFIINQMENWYLDIDQDFVDSVQEAEQRNLEDDFSKKGKRVYIAHTAGEIRSCIIASRKRGKGIKVSPLLTEVTGDKLEEFISFAEQDIKKRGEVRKFYSHVPLLDGELLQKFKSAGYETEGVLREPYKPGVDMVFVGKFA